MTLSPGTRIGSCEILSPLGAGGMGEVYRARDVRLDRIVAIKSLAREFSGDMDRLARFEREAKLLAALNHPNIAAIYGIEDADGAPYLVLEFVDGATLTRRIAEKPLTVGETLDVGAQIAAAVEAAHQKGIVHRDLKPGNIMITPAGAVKVLDFGLARGGAPVSGLSGDLSATPTVALSSTREGLILGTAPYMSPEQARGRAVDERTDIWAFGCVMLECLTGRVTFGADTVPDAIARILEREPDWTALPAAMPQRLLDLLKRCLSKDAGGRPRAAELRSELAAVTQEISSGSAVMSRPGGDRPSLAVLYFENLSSDAESDYFCAGITEDILTDLSKIRKLRVASRNAVARYRGKTVDPAEVAKELGVSAVLEGSVRRAGDRVRISAQLISAADGFHLWAERYDRTLEDVFAVQEEIASSIAEALRVTLSPKEMETLGENRPKDARAYDLYLRGRQEYGRYAAESFQKALELFQEATAFDPNYALAWAGIADCHSQRFTYGFANDPDAELRAAFEAARRAVSLNAQLAEAHKALALAFRTAGDYEAERVSLKQALEVNPRFCPALINLGVDRFSLADMAAAERYHRRVLSIDPQEAFAAIWLGFLLFLTERHEEVLAIAERVASRADSSFYVNGAFSLRALVALRRDDHGAVARWVREGRAAGAYEHCMRAYEGLLNARRGDADAARRILHARQEVNHLGLGGLLALTETAILLREVDVAVRFMEEPVVGELDSTLIRMHPPIHNLLELEKFAPRRADRTLVWPLEAPMIDAARFRVYREVKIESGRAEASDITSKPSESSRVQSS